MTSAAVDFDIGIIGGGPAGAGIAAYLAKAGVKCVLLERELFPREHVGESLVPSATRVFKELGFLEKLDQSGFPKKFGAAWTANLKGINIQSHDFAGIKPDCDARIRFDERAQPGVDRNYTFHVDRGKFDLMLLQHASELGATVYQGVRVDHVDFEDGPLVKIHFTKGQQSQHLCVRMVVDASGRQTLLGNQLKLKVRDPVFDQYAIHSWFEDFDRTATSGPGQEEMKDYIFVHFLPMRNTWMWQIPISDTVTSIGAVTQKKTFTGSRAHREAFFWETAGTRPELLAALQKARQLRPFKDEGDYSYAMKQICGDRFVMIGDAARFVDPIFSTGVSIALNCARFAHRDILKALETGCFERSSFSTFESTIRRGTKNWYEFISVYYRLNILFTYFIAKPEYRLDVIKLLQGDVYDDDEPPVLTKMREIVSSVERNKDHVWHGALNDLTSADLRPVF